MGLEKKPFVYFDLGQVVLDFKRAYPELARRFDLNLDRVMEVFALYDDAMCRDEYDFDELWEFYKRDLEISDQEETKIFNLLDFLVEQFKPILEVHALIQELISLGFSVGLLSNAPTILVDRLFEKGTIPQVDYKVKIISGSHKVIKPSEPIYDLAEQLSGESGIDILFIDDREVNLDVPVKKGWQTHLFNPSEALDQVDQIRKRLGLHQ